MGEIVETCGECRAPLGWVLPVTNHEHAAVSRGIRMAKPKCATFDLGATYDPDYCDCTNIAHATAEAPASGWEPYLTDGRPTAV